MTQTLTLDGEVSAALEMAHHSDVLSLFAVVHILDNQFVGLVLGDHLVVVVLLQLGFLVHPFYGDVFLRDLHLEHGSRSQQ